jgi:hypothetical protein
MAALARRKKDDLKADSDHQLKGKNLPVINQQQRNHQEISLRNLSVVGSTKGKGRHLSVGPPDNEDMKEKRPP